MTPKSADPPDPDERLILGIDPGSIATGFGLVRCRSDEAFAVEFGVLRPPVASAALPVRLAGLFEGLEALIVRAEPDALAVENVFIHRNAKSAFSLAYSRGIVLLAAARAQLPVREYTPRQVKKSVTGTGAAEKSQVQTMVRLLLGIDEGEGIPLDASDALAVALCDARCAAFDEAVKAASAPRSGREGRTNRPRRSGRSAAATDGPGGGSPREGR